MKGALALRNPTQVPITNSNAGANITTAAYLQLSAALPGPASAINVMNTSSSPIIIAVGAAAAEQDKYVVAPGLTETFPIELKKGARLSAKAIGANATTGFLVVNFLG